MCFEYGSNVFCVSKTYKLIKVLAKKLVNFHFWSGFIFPYFRIFFRIFSQVLFFVSTDIFVSFYFFFLFGKVSRLLTRILALFVFIFFRNILIPFTRLFWSFSLFFLMTQPTLLYIRKKYLKNVIVKYV